MFRFILALIIHCCIDFIALPPTLGKEMGKLEGDKPANIDITYKDRFIKFTMTYIGSILHVIFMYGCPLSYIEFLCFIIVVMGTIVSLHSYYTLGSLYTFDIGIRKDHKIINQGLYQFIAHPGYLGQLLVLFGATMFFDVYKIFASILMSWICYCYYNRIHKEEEMLKKEFGEIYKNYLRNVYHLIPGIW